MHESSSRSRRSSERLDQTSIVLAGDESRGEGLEGGVFSLSLPCFLGVLGAVVMLEAPSTFFLFLSRINTGIVTQASGRLCKNLDGTRHGRQAKRHRGDGGVCETSTRNGRTQLRTDWLLTSHDDAQNYRNVNFHSLMSFRDDAASRCFQVLEFYRTSTHEILSHQLGRTGAITFPSV